MCNKREFLNRKFNNMTNFVAFCVILQANIVPILGFFHEPSTSIFRPRNVLHKDSYFGYSMDYFNKSLIIGAPAADRLGKVFTYNLLRVNEPPNEIFSELKSTYETTRMDWFGATIKSGHSSVVVCAPRYFNFITTDNSTAVTRGQCFEFSEGNRYTIADIAPTARKHFNGGIDAYGWSVDVGKPIWIGSPALPPRAVKIYRVSISTLLPYNNTTNEYNFGYSIINGNFLTKKGNCRAVSSTYGDHGKGKVVIYDEKFDKQLEISGNQVGSMFGAALCKANLGDNRASLLVGAPAFAAGNYEYNRGAVYLYVSNGGERSAKNLTLKRIIKGEVDAAFFGHAIASLGDLDGDDKDEIAIGAPFENNGRGAIYIYSGDGLLGHKTWSQRIQPAETNWFGYSFVPITDYNVIENGSNELAVSAPMSQNVYIFKSIPAITVNLEVILPNSQNRRLNSSYVDFITVVNIIYPKTTAKITAKITVKLEIIHPNAKLEKATSDGTAHYTFSLDTRKDNYYNTFRVSTPKVIIKKAARQLAPQSKVEIFDHYARENADVSAYQKDGYYDQVLSYKASVHLENRPEEEGKFDSGCVQFSDRSVLLKQGVLWLTDCKADDGHCIPDLKATWLDTINKPYTVGSSEKEQLSFTVRNAGETAYAACVVVTLIGARVLQPPSCCAFKSIDQVQCKPQRPIHNGDKWESGNIELEMNSLTSKSNLSILLDVYNDCANETDKNSVGKLYQLNYDTNIDVTGVSMPNDVVNMTTIEIKDGTKFQHHYTIINHGSTKWMDAKCEILLEKKDYLQYQNEIVVIRTDSFTSKCSIESDNSSTDNFIANCNLGDLSKNQKTELYIYIDVLPNTLGDIIKKQNVTVPTEIKLILSEDLILPSERVITTLVLNTVTVPVWVIITALLISLLILLLLIFVLYECDCFERKNKKKLKELKTTTESIRLSRENSRNQSAYQKLQEDENPK